MSRRRRGSDEPPVSLFAFQDVMTSVMAIILLVALLLALESSGVGTRITDHEVPRDELIARKVTAVSALERLRADVAARPDQPRRRLISERIELDVFYRRIEAAESDLAKEYANLKADIADPGVQGALDELTGMEADAAAKLGELQELVANRRLTYITGQRSSRTPVLVELSSSAWRIALSHQADVGISITHPNQADRLAGLTALLRPTPPSTHYVLLIVKPSGYKQYEAVRKAISGLGYQLGTDVLPEDWTSVIGDIALPQGERP